MSKLTLTTISNPINSTTMIANINSNSDLIETAFDNVLSRDGTAPNQMSADLDMNSHRILNLPSPSSDNEPVRKIDYDPTVATQAAQSAASAATSATSAQNSADAAQDAASVLSGAVRFDEAQTLTSNEKTQVCTNLGLADVASSGDAADITGAAKLTTLAVGSNLITNTINSTVGSGTSNSAVVGIVNGSCGLRIGTNGSGIVNLDAVDNTLFGSFKAISIGGSLCTITPPLTITSTTDTTSVSTGALIVKGGAGIAKGLTVGGSVFLTNLPTTDPLVDNQLWNDSGILKISSGS